MIKFNKPFATGDPVLFLDKKEREYFAILENGKITNIRGDMLPHDEIIGNKEGFFLVSQRGGRFRVFRPTLAEYTRLMPRGAQVIYPKDNAMMLTMADIYPGAKVVESGLGSGALTANLLRAVGTRGKVISYEVREDFVRNATKNLQTYFGATKNHQIRVLDIYESFVDRNVDRLMLDLPEPWRVLPLATPRLRTGAIVCSYSPTILQVKEFVDALHQQRQYTAVQTVEVLVRAWKVDAISVRPNLRMVAHTAFITIARRMHKQALKRLPRVPEQSPNENTDDLTVDDADSDDSTN